MNMLTFNSYRLMISIMALFIPFAYFSLYGFRVLVLLPAVVLFFVLIKISAGTSSIRKLHNSLYVYLLLFVISLVYLIFTQQIEFLFTLILFGILTYWPYFLSSHHFTEKKLLTLIKIYLVFALFMAIGTYIQVVLFFFYGIDIGRVEFYGGGRIAFSFIWSDFSFLSLYFVSAIPLLFKVFSKKTSYLLTFLLIIASLITSARTGMASFVVVIAILFIFSFFSSIYKGKVSKLHISFIAVALFLGSLIIGLKDLFMNRELTLSGSGRLEGYYNALVYFSDNYLFGALLDPDIYRYSVDVIPHNIFIYMLSMGGILFFIVFIFWLLSVVYTTFKSDRYVMLSIMISLVGFNFIPSFFSAYYFAFLLSIMFFHQLYKKQIQSTQDMKNE